MTRWGGGFVVMEVPRIRLVPTRWYWLLVGVFTAILVGLGFAFLSPNPHTGAAWRASAAAILASLVAFPATFVAWMYVARIEADEAGLRWRTLRGNRTASWHDVLDYYKCPTTQNGATRTVGCIITRNGKLRIDSDWIGNVEGFRAMVQERAVNAKANSWDRIGMRRDVDWPQEHGYDTADNRVMGVVMPLLSIVLVALWVWMLWPKIPRSFTDPGFGWTIATLVIASVLPFSMIVPGFYAWLIERESGARRRDKVVVSREGLSLVQPGKTTRMDWNDVERFYIDSTNPRLVRGWPLYVVESENDRIEFTQSIQNFTVLKALIAREAVAAHQDCWLNNAALRENLDRCASERTVDARGRTRRLFHYRTRTNRRTIIYGVAVGATMTLIPLLGCLGFINPVAFPDLYFVSFPAILLWTIWRYRTAGIVTTSSEITEIALFGSRTLSWESVARCRIVGEEFVPLMILTDASGKQIRFWLSICDVAELQREIRRRAPQVDSAWDRSENRRGSANSAIP